MRIKFLKDHVDYVYGDVAEDHPNAEYLIKSGVAKKVSDEVKEENKEVKKEEVKAPVIKKKKGK